MLEHSSRQIRTAVKWSAITEIMSKLVSPISNAILARLLTPDAFGCIATVSMVISFAEMFADAGFQKYLIQRDFASETEKDEATTVAFWTNLSVSVFLCIMIILFRESIARMVGSPDLGVAIGVSSTTILLTSFSSIQTAILKRNFDFKTLFYVRVVATLVPLVVTVPLAFITRNYWALIIGVISLNICNVIVLTIGSRWRPRVYYSVKQLRNMFSFSFWTLLETISIWLTANIDVFIIASVLSSYYLGLYKTAMHTVSQIMKVVITASTPVLFSALCRLQADETEYRRVYFRFQRIVGCIAIPMGVGMFVFRRFITQLLLGEQWSEAADLLGIWGLTGGFAILLNNFASEVYRSKGKPRLSTLAQLFQIAVLVPAISLTVNRSFAHLTLARATVRLVSWIVHLFIMHYTIKIRPLEILRNILPATISAGAMAVFAYGVNTLLSIGSKQVALNFFSILLCVVFYFAFLLILFPRLREEVVQELKSKRI